MCGRQRQLDSGAGTPLRKREGLGEGRCARRSAHATLEGEWRAHAVDQERERPIQFFTDRDSAEAATAMGKTIPLKAIRRGGAARPGGCIGHRPTVLRKACSP